MNKNLIVALFAVIVPAYLCLVLFGQPQGIIAIEGWGEGVALCDGGEDAPLTNIDDVGHQWKKDGIFYFINVGHLDSPMVKKLEERATVECAQFLEAK